MYNFPGVRSRPSASNKQQATRLLIVSSALALGRFSKTTQPNFLTLCQPHTSPALQTIQDSLVLKYFKTLSPPPFPCVVYEWPSVEMFRQVIISIYNGWCMGLLCRMGTSSFMSQFRIADTILILTYKIGFPTRFFCKYLNVC